MAMTQRNEPTVITSTLVSVATSTRKRMAEGGESSLAYNCFVTRVPRSLVFAWSGHETITPHLVG